METWCIIKQSSGQKWFLINMNSINNHEVLTLSKNCCYSINHTGSAIEFDHGSITRVSPLRRLGCRCGDDFNLNLIGAQLLSKCTWHASKKERSSSKERAAGEETSGKGDKSCGRSSASSTLTT
jgi:hypothetical protein